MNIDLRVYAKLYREIMASRKIDRHLAIERVLIEQPLYYPASRAYVRDKLRTLENA